jgi:hypothetical protein
MNMNERIWMSVWAKNAFKDVEVGYDYLDP